MRILAVAVQIEEDGSMFRCDAIDYEGKIWLVPEWLASPAEQVQRPARMICVDGLPTITLSPAYRVDFALHKPIPKAVLEGREKSPSLVVLEAPDLSVPIPPEGMN